MLAMFESVHQMRVNLGITKLGSVCKRITTKMLFSALMAIQSAENFNRYTVEATVE